MSVTVHEIVGELLEQPGRCRVCGLFFSPARPAA